MYEWSVNQMKLQRAITESKGDQTKVKGLYISYGGLIKKGYEVSTSETTVPTGSSDVNVFAQPKKRGRQTKNA